MLETVSPSVFSEDILALMFGLREEKDCSKFSWSKKFGYQALPGPLK
jgi:hypothetical protein